MWGLSRGGLTLERAHNFLFSDLPRAVNYAELLTDLHADLFRCAQRVEHAADDLRRARAARFVGRLLLHELGMREDDAELVVQLVKKLAKFQRLFHSAPLEQIGH